MLKALFLNVLGIVVVPGIIFVAGMFLVATSRRDPARILLGGSIAALPVWWWILLVSRHGWSGGGGLATGSAILLGLALTALLWIVLRSMWRLIRRRGHRYQTS